MGSNLVTIVRNFAISIETFEPDDHDVQDACLTPGQHRIMRFDFFSHNAGDTDVLVGSPEDRPDLFVWSAGHGHYHLKDFNEFKLFNTSGEEVVIGHKQALHSVWWTRSRWIRMPAQTPSLPIATLIKAYPRGADLYYAGLPCQYIMIDGLPDGDYTLQSTTNSMHIVEEESYSDNTVWSGLRIEGNNVMEIPPPWIPDVAATGDDKLRGDFFRGAAKA
jgi:hypothetical protein